MKKSLMLLTLGLTLVSSAFSQDLIITKDAKKIEGKVVDTSADLVKYKTPGDTTNTTYVMSKSQVAAISYSDGKVETFYRAHDRHFNPDSAAVSADSQPEQHGHERPYYPAPGSENAANMEMAPQEALRPDRPRHHEHSRHQQKGGIRFKFDVGPMFSAKNFYDQRIYRDNDGNRHMLRDSSANVDGGMEASLTFGYQFNPFFFFGAGVDFVALDQFDWIAYSEFLEMNVQCLRYKLTPVVNLRVGISNESRPSDRIGSFVEPGVGLAYKFSPKCSLGVLFGYRSTYLDNEPQIHEDAVEERGNFNTIGAYFTKLYVKF